MLIQWTVVQEKQHEYCQLTSIICTAKSASYHKHLNYLQIYQRNSKYKPNLHIYIYIYKIYQIYHNILNRFIMYRYLNQFNTDEQNKLSHLLEKATYMSR